MILITKKEIAMTETALPIQAGDDLAAKLGMCRLPIGNKTLELTFDCSLSRTADTPSGLDKWAVTIRNTKTNSIPVISTHGTPPGVQPHPYNVLARIGSDVSLALQMPINPHAASSWLIEEGYAVYRQDADIMRAELSTALALADELLDGSTITPAEFAETAATLPLVIQKAPQFMAPPPIPKVRVALPASLQHALRSFVLQPQMEDIPT